MAENRYQFITDCNLKEFDAFVEQHEAGSILQESSWAHIKANWDCYRVVMKDVGGIQAAAQILSRNIAFGYKLFYIPRGPVMDYQNRELCSCFMHELKVWAKKKHAAFIKIDPLILNSYVGPDGSSEEHLNEDIISMLEEFGFIHHGLTMGFEETVQPRSQAVVDLIRPIKMNKKLKYYLNHAGKKGVRVQRMGAEGVDLFARLESLTAERKNIALRSRDYFQLLMDTYKENADISIAYINIPETRQEEEKRLEQLKKQQNNPQYKAAKLQEIQEQIDSTEKALQVLSEMHQKYGNIVYISGALIIRSNHFSEMLYAGMDEDLSIYRSNSSFQDALDWARENGCRYCNLGGVEGTLDDSLSAYKKLYSPTFESYIGEFDLPINTVLYLAVTRLLPAVRKFHTFAARRKK